MNELKVFTLEEANRLLPELSRLISLLQVKRDEVAQIEAKVDALELVTTVASNTPHHEVTVLVESHHQCVTEFYDLVEQIHQHQCFLKDVDKGLVDFYGVIDGHVVYFCWCQGEQEISYWHEIGQGFLNRTLIPNV